MRGFHPEATTVSDLTELFQQFGSVHKVILNEKVIITLNQIKVSNKIF